MSDQRPVYTLKSKPAVLSSYDEAMEVAHSLGPRLRERAQEAEELRRLPDANVTDLLESGLYGVMKPKRFGGSELGSETMIDVSVELASHCSSTGWVYMLWTAHMWMQALWPPDAQEEMFANPNTLASSVVSTSGDVVPVDGGYRWTGRGFFSSGVDHCNWLTAAVPIKSDGEGEPERRWMLIPREDFEILDDWYVIGLKGTGSKTIILNDVFIPFERTLDNKDLMQGTSPGMAINPNPMYGATMFSNFAAAMSAPAIGAARGMLREFEGKLRSKVNNTDRPDVKSIAYVPGVLETTMARYANAAAQVDSIQALLLQNAQRFSRVPASKVSPEDNAKCRRDMTFTAQVARTAANALHAEGGGSGLLESSNIQRFWRDTNAAAAHHGLTWDWQADAWPKAVLGLSPM